MNLCFIICAVCGMIVLACQTIASVLGVGELLTFANEDDDSDEAADAISGKPGEMPGLESASSTGDDIPLPRWRRALTRIGAAGLAIAFFGLMGCAAEATHLNTPSILGAAMLSGLIAYFVGLYLLSRTAIQPFDESNVTDDGDPVAYAVDEEDHSQHPNPWVAC